MSARPLAFACASLLLVAHAGAQRLLVPHGSPSARVALVDATAGVLVDGAFLDVAATASPAPSPNGLADVERVGDEVWIAAGRWVYRYDIPTRAFLGSFDTGAIVRGLEAWRGRVFVARDDAIGVRSGSGVPLGELPIVGAHDVLHLEDGSMLVARRAAFRVVRYAADGSFVGNFAGPTIPTPFGIFSHPEQLSPGRAPNGEATVLVSGDVRVYEFTVEGTFLREIDVGPFEAGVSETLSGSILVSLGTGLALHDPETAFTSSVGGAFFGSGRKIGFFDRGLGAVPDEHDGRIGARAVCRGASTNDASAGRIAVLGSADPEDGALFVQVSGLPPGTPAIAAVARSASLPATLVAGARCLDSGSTVVLDEIAVAGTSGAAFLSLRPANSTEASTVLAGATYFVQVAYRLDGSPFLTGALELRLR